MAQVVQPDAGDPGLLDELGEQVPDVSGRSRSPFSRVKTRSCSHHALPHAARSSSCRARWRRRTSMVTCSTGTTRTPVAVLEALRWGPFPGSVTCHRTRSWERSTSTSTSTSLQCRPTASSRRIPVKTTRWDRAKRRCSREASRNYAMCTGFQTAVQAVRPSAWSVEL